MADVTENILLYNGHGAVSDGEVLKVINNRTYLCKKPDMAGVVPSASQLINRAALKRATAFAKQIITNSDIKAIYPVKPNQTVYHAAIQDFLNNTVPADINVSIDKIPVSQFGSQQHKKTENKKQKRKEAALKFLDQYQTITNQAYQLLNKVAKPTATRELKELVSENLIAFSGKKGIGAEYFKIR